MEKRLSVGSLGAAVNIQNSGIGFLRVIVLGTENPAVQLIIPEGEGNALAVRHISAPQGGEIEGAQPPGTAMALFGKGIQLLQPALIHTYGQDILALRTKIEIVHRPALPDDPAAPARRIHLHEKDGVANGGQIVDRIAADPGRPGFTQPDALEKAALHGAGHTRDAGVKGLDGAGHANGGKTAERRVLQGMQRAQRPIGGRAENRLLKHFVIIEGVGVHMGVNHVRGDGFPYEINAFTALRHRRMPPNLFNTFTPDQNFHFGLQLVPNSVKQLAAAKQRRFVHMTGPHPRRFRPSAEILCDPRTRKRMCVSFGGRAQAAGRHENASITESKQKKYISFLKQRSFSENI